MALLLLKRKSVSIVYFYLIICLRYYVFLETNVQLFF